MAITRSRVREGLDAMSSSTPSLRIIVSTASTWPCGNERCDTEGLGRRDEGLALEGAFDDLDEVIGKMGKVAESLMGDGLSLANGPSEQMSDVGLTLVDPLGRGHVYAAASCWHAAIL